MKHHLRVVVAALACLILTVPATAQPRAGDCVIGTGLGSTLLFPYFEADLTSFSGPTTLISINNGLSNAALVRVVLWTDWGNPTLAFDMYLPGFSVNTLNLRDTFNGGVPSTGEGVDLSAFPFCDILPPFHSNPALTADQQAQLRADHTGQVGPLAVDCAGSTTGDQIARGYITVDVVDECSGLEGFAPNFTPANTTFPYFDDGASSGIGKNDNRLWGDIFYLSNDESSAHGSGAIPLWADSTLFAGSNVYTFYGRFSGFDGRDNRVPLPFRWDQRFINGGPFAGGADLIVYHDVGRPPSYVFCGSEPPGIPIGGDHMTAVRDSGSEFLNLDFTELAGLVSQRASVSDLPIPFAFGWLQLDSGTGLTGQMWVQPTLSAAGIYSALVDGTPVDFLCDETPPPVMLAPQSTDEKVYTSDRLNHRSEAAQLKLEVAGRIDGP